MGRTPAVVWHASFSIAAGVLYFFFVLPRWPELLGETPPTLGTVLRIVTGALIGIAALPVVFTLLRTRRPEYGTPQLALTLRTSSIALQVLAGVLIVGTAISEIWLSLDSVGQWLFGIYGAAAAIALLGMFTFYLAFVAELPPPPPKPLKPKKKRRRGRRKAVDDAAPEEPSTGETAGEDQASGDSAEEDQASEESAEEKPTEVTAAEETETDEVTAAEETETAAEEATSTDEEVTPTAQDGPTSDDAESGRDEPNEDTPVEQDTTAADAGAPSGKLRNRRPSGKVASWRRRRQLRDGVALED